MSYLVSHPDNIELLRRSLVETPPQVSPIDRLSGIEIRPDSAMEKDRSTGRYHVAGREGAVSRDQLAVPFGPFCELTGTDAGVKMVLEWGLIEEEREVIYYLINEQHWNFDLAMIL